MVLLFARVTSATSSALALQEKLLQGCRPSCTQYSADLRSGAEGCSPTLPAVPGQAAEHSHSFCISERPTRKELLDFTLLIECASVPGGWRSTFQQCPAPRGLRSSRASSSAPSRGAGTAAHVLPSTRAVRTPGPWSRAALLPCAARMARCATKQQLLLVLKESWCFSRQNCSIFQLPSDLHSKLHSVCPQQYLADGRRQLGKSGFDIRQ